jgi:two-component system C4-dicarboxylate transport sensor histidine kinase DctB
MRALLRQRLVEWTRAFPPLELLRETSNSKAWALSALLAGCIIALAAWVPFTSDLFQLRPWPAVAAFAAAFALNLLEQRALARRQLRLLALLLAIGSGLFQLFILLLVTRSSLVGAVVFGACLAIIAALHGHAYRSAWRFPFIGLASLVACAAAIPTAPTREHVALLAALGPLAAVSACLVGQWTVSSDRARLETERLREAIQSQLVWEHSLRAERLAGSLEQVAQWNHDMRNALTSVACGARLLAELEQERGSNPRDQEARATFDSMKRTLDVVIAGFEGLRRISRLVESSAEKQAVAVMPIAESVAAGVRSRYPEIELAIDSELVGERVLVYGGASSVHRIVENLVLNACEGDGRSAAGRVDLRLRKLPGAVRLEILDDGPGFPPKYLAGPAPAFATTKEHGTGLGLHSVEQLVAASDGKFTRANLPAGGAAAVVELPMEGGEALRKPQRSTAAEPDAADGPAVASS